MRGRGPTRRRLVAWLAAAPLAGAALRPAPVRAQRIGGEGMARPGLQAEASEALISTVVLVLRSTYARHRDTLPDFMLHPQPLPPEIAEALAVRAPLPEPLRDQPVPVSLNRRLPHTRGSSVWAVGGRDLIEVDPARLTVLNIVRDAIPEPFAGTEAKPDGT